MRDQRNSEYYLRERGLQYCTGLWCRARPGLARSRQPVTLTDSSPAGREAVQHIPSPRPARLMRLNTGRALPGVHSSQSHGAPEEVFTPSSPK